MSEETCGSLKAMVTAVGWPCATSAAKLGPESAPMESRRPGRFERLREHLGHAEMGALFKALGGADHELAVAQVGPNALQSGAEKLRWDDRNDDIGLKDGGAVSGDEEIFGQGKAGEELLVLAGGGDLLGELFSVGPERDLMAAAAAKGESDGGSPGTGTEYGDAAHAIFLAPKRDSVPATRRRMF